MEVTLDKIIETLSTWVREKHPIDAHTWVDASAKLVLLLADEHEKLFSLQQQVALQKSLLAENNTVAKANLMIEGTDGYRMMKSQEAKIKRVEELIRISKLQARMASNEMGFH